MAEQENFLIPGEQLSKENLTESIADKLHHNTTYRTSSDKIQKSMQDMIETMFPKKLSNETKGFQLGDGLSITSDGVVHVGKTIGVLHYAYISMTYQDFWSGSAWESAWRLMSSTGSSYGLTEDDFQDTMKYTFFFANKETLAETLEPVEFTCRIIFGQVCFQTNANLENYLYGSTGIAGIYYFSDTTEGTYFSLKNRCKGCDISFNLNCPKVDLLVVNWCAGDNPGDSRKIRYITMNDCENGNSFKMLFNEKMGSSYYANSFWGRSDDLNSNISQYIYNILPQGCMKTGIYIDFLYWNGLWYVNDGV